MRLHTWLIAWLRHTLGRRGASLLFFGILDVFLCGALVLVPGEQRQGQGVMVFPDRVWIVAFGVSGVVSIVSAFLQPGRDSVGFATAILVKMLWGTAFIAAAVWGPAPWLVGFVGFTWWLIAVHAAIVAGWAETSGGVRRPAPPAEGATS